MTAGTAFFQVLVFPGLVFLIGVGLAGEFVDRKLYARLQNRVGPPWFQPLADVLKLLGKEKVVPEEADRRMFTLAPVVALAAVVASFLYIPMWGPKPVFAFEGDLVVVLCHLPAPEARLLAEAAPEVDVFVTGHSHQETQQPIHAGNALIVQALPFGEAMGRLRIEVDAGTRGARVLDNTLLETTATPVDVRPGLAQLLKAGLLLCALVLLCFF